MLSPLQWAYLGDAIYELQVRMIAISRGDIPMREIHRWTVGFVKAESQAKVLRRLESLLTEEESEIVRRARNVKSLHVPKNAKVADYRYATALEGLLGFLCLMNRHERLAEILVAIQSVISEMEAEKTDGQNKLES